MNMTATLFIGFVFFLSSTVHARRSDMREVGVFKDFVARSVSYAVLTDQTQPLCYIDLSDEPHFVPKFHQMRQSSPDVRRPDLPRCTGDQRATVQWMAQSATPDSRVAVFPAVVLPLVYCAVAAGFMTSFVLYSAHHKKDGLKPLMWRYGAGQALGGAVGALLESNVARATARATKFAALDGFLVGSVCSAVGGLGTLLYLERVTR